MSFEPNKDSFIARLKDEGFTPESLTENIEAIQEALWFLDEERASSIAKEILIVAEDEREVVIKNLAKLYPISGSLVMEIMQKSQNDEFPEDDFKAGFDTGNSLLREIKKVFQSIEKRRGRLATASAGYVKDIDVLNQKIQMLQGEESTCVNLKKERDNLFAKVEKLKADTDPDRLNDEIELLKAEEARRSEEKRNHEEAVGTYKQRIKEIAKELKDTEEESTGSREQQLLRDLLKCFESDAEGDE